MIKTQAHKHMKERDDEREGIVYWNKDAQAQCLRVESDNEVFVFPYAHLLSVRLTREENREILEISFSTHTVQVSGRNLRELLPSLQKLSVEWLREAPVRYAVLASKDAVFIESIEVNEAAESQSNQ